MKNEQDNIMNGNILIAKFIGEFQYDMDDKTYAWRFPENTIPDLGIYIYDEDLQFHSSWDWIMPAWKKFFDTIESENLMKRNFPFYGNWYSKITGAIISADIQKAHELLCFGIKIYDSIKAHSYPSNHKS